MTEKNNSRPDNAVKKELTVSPDSLTIHYVDDIEFDVFEFVARIFGRWRFLLIFSLLGLILSLVYYFKAEPQYTAKIVASVEPSPYSSGDSGGLGAGSLVSLALGGGQSNDRVNNAVLILRGQSFPYRFASNKQILPALFPQRWDKANSKWLPKSGLFGLGKSRGAGQDLIPTEHETYKLFGDICDVEAGGTGSVLAISVTSSSPQSSVDWVNSILRQLNREMWERDVSFSKNLRETLYEEVRKEQILEIREALFNSISRESEKLSYASANDPDNYIFRVLDGPILPDYPSSPRLLLLLVAGPLLGFLIALLWVLLRELKRGR